MSLKNWKITELVFLLMIVALIVGLFSCSSEMNDGDDEDDSSDDDSCIRDSDCDGGELCAWSKCLQYCRDDDDCSGDLFCHDKGVCTECVQKENCRDNQTCVNGQCVRESSDGGECEKNSDCVGGQICQDGECIPLCTVDEECPESMPYCHPNHFCVQCYKDVQCPEDSFCEDYVCFGVDQDGDVPDGDTPDGDTPIECEEECDPNLGYYCDTASGSCKQVVCSPCDEDADCREPAVCRADAAANGNGICLIDLENCPAGYARSADDLCHPTALCMDVTYAGLAESCSYPSDTSRPSCEFGLLCLYNSSDISFCSTQCGSDVACMDDFPDGCCGEIEGMGSYCVTAPFRSLCE